VLSKLPLSADPNVLVGHAGSDDAGVYRISDDMALVLSLDYFTPIVDDAYDYGRIAATNSLSDIYAMGARPIAALNIAGFPESRVPAEVLGEIVRGGAEQALRAGVPVLGGHTVNDAELKYGLAVVGQVHPERIVTNAGARPGDRLVLTKPIGTGMLATALKNGRLDDRKIARIVEVMTTLNKDASERMLAHGVRSCTDITGYGLAGHAHELAEASGVTVEIDAASVPLIEGALEAVADGQIPGGARTNRAFFERSMQLAREIDEHLLMLMFDPQTSGGLLIAVPESEAEALMRELRPAAAEAAVVGRCAEKGAVTLVIR
jgi:selenide,water dikinase